jgi:glycosyltransferase involved in cell wall biosynthesis
VIIPCYQQAHFLGDAIDSVVTQGYSNVEVIVVNDGSHDATAAVAARYPTVRYVYQENAGLAAARNRGLSLVSGEYVVFLDADDRLLPGALRAQVRHLAANRSAGFVVGRSYYITKEGTPLPTTQQPHPSGDAYAALLQRNRIRTPAMVMFRRLALERSGPFDSRVDACADYDMYLRVARLYPVEFHDGVVAEYRRHDQNMSLNDALMLSQLCGVIRRQWRHARGNHRLRAAWHEGRRSMREYYGDRLANRIRDRIRRRAGLAGTLRDAAILSIYHPMGLVGHLFRKTVNSAKKNREPDSSDRGSVALPS